MYSRTSCAMKRMKLTTCSGLPRELRPQPRVLRGDAHRAGVQVAGAHHDAAERDERGGGEAELLRARAAPPMTTSRPVLSWPSTSTVMRLRRSFRTRTWCVSARPSSQGMPACLMRGERGGAGAAVVAGDEHHVRVRLGDARRDGAHAHLGDQLHADARVAVGVLQVVDELLQVLDGVDVVVRRRRDEAHARRGVAHLGDPRVDFGAGQLAALAGLGALGHLDLQLARVDQVVAGDAEPRRTPPA